MLIENGIWQLKKVCNDVEVLNYANDIVLFKDSDGVKHVLTGADFLEQYTIVDEDEYEYQFVFELDYKRNGFSNKYVYPHSDKEYYTKKEASEEVLAYINYVEWHCLEFTKRKRVIKETEEC